MQLLFYCFREMKTDLGNEFRVRHPWLSWNSCLCVEEKREGAGGHMQSRSHAQLFDRTAPVKMCEQFRAEG